jgi:sentrin-specific protease 7
MRERIHLFSTFFYSRLCDDGHGGVSKWTEDCDIFTKDFLIVPICEHLHWFLAIICYAGRLLEAVSSSDQDGEGSPCFVLIFDSLGRSRHRVLARLKGYLVDEARDKLKVDISRDRIQGTMVKCPQQTNYTDCGLFTCHYFDLFLKDPMGCVVKAQNHELVSWFPVCEAENRREVLKERIALIASTSTYEHPPDQSGNSSDIEEIICLD